MTPVRCEASIDDVQITIDRSQISGKFYKMKKQTTVDCQKCGRQHEPRQCPAYVALCHKCGKSNHFSKVCRTVGGKRDNFKTKTVNNIESEMDSLYIGMIHSNGQKAVSHSKDSKWFKTVTVRDVPIKFKLILALMPVCFPCQFLGCCQVPFSCGPQRLL